jgi:hypothetical protein
MAKKTYTAMPSVPPEVAARYETMMSVLSGEVTVSEGARRLSLSRNHFQTLMHRALGSLIEELGPKAGGRPKVPASERRLQQETEKLRLENARLRRRVETTDRILNVASGLLKGRLGRRIGRDGGESGPGKSSSEDE